MMDKKTHLNKPKIDPFYQRECDPYSRYQAHVKRWPSTKISPTTQQTCLKVKNLNRILIW